MKTVITPISGSSQIIEFNSCLDHLANAAISPVSTLTINQRWAKVINTSTTSTPSYVQLTKLDLILNILYTDTKGNTLIETNIASTIISTSATSDSITPITMESTKAVDIIIPCSVDIVDQQILNQMPYVAPVSGKCAYSVFLILQQVTSQA